MIFPNSPSNRRPGRLEGEYTFNIVALQQLSGGWVEDARFNTKEWNSSTSRLCWDSSREWSNNNGTCLSLPEGVDHSALLLTDMFVIPVPCFRIDWFTNGAEDTERRKVMSLYVIWSKAAKQTNSGRGAVELSELVLGDCFPVARWCRVNWGRFEDAVIIGKRESKISSKR